MSWSSDEGFAEKLRNPQCKFLVSLPANGHNYSGVNNSEQIICLTNFFASHEKPMSSSQALHISLLFLFIYLLWHSFYWVCESHGGVCSFLLFCNIFACVDWAWLYIHIKYWAAEVWVWSSSLELQHLHVLFLRCSFQIYTFVSSGLCCFLWSSHGP